MLTNRDYDPSMSTVPTGLNDDQLAAWATHQPATSPAFRPTDLRLDRREGLTVTWGDGVVSRYPLVYLRKRCPCATCRTERETSGATESGSASKVASLSGEPGKRSISLSILPEGVDRATQFVDAKMVGSYAIQITWGDGHSTGIYDFRYLRVIAPR